MSRKRVLEKPSDNMEQSVALNMGIGLRNLQLELTSFRVFKSTQYVLARS